MAWGLMTLCFFVGMIVSLTYIVSYFKPVDEPIVIVSPKEASNQETEEESVVDLEEDATTPENSGVYTPYDLEFLKAFHMVLTFEKDQRDADEQMIKMLEAYKDLFQTHRLESIVIEGYFTSGANAEKISETRLKAIALYFNTLGIDSDKISVYNLTGDLKSEDRVEIYYKDHFQKAPLK